MRTQHYKKLIVAASPKLKQKLSVWTFRWISKVTYFRDTSSQFTVAVVEHIKGALFTPSESLNLFNRLCVINRGIAARDGRILLSGSILGEDMILSAGLNHLKDLSPVVALTYVEAVRCAARTCCLSWSTSLPTRLSFASASSACSSSAWRGWYLQGSRGGEEAAAARRLPVAAGHDARPDGVSAARPGAHGEGCGRGRPGPPSIWRSWAPRRTVRSTPTSATTCPSSTAPQPTRTTIRTRRTAVGRQRGQPQQ